MVPVFSQRYMIVLLHLGSNAVLHNKWVFRKGLKQDFFFFEKKLFSAKVFVLEVFVVVQFELIGDGFVQLFDTVKI